MKKKKTPIKHVRRTKKLRAQYFFMGLAAVLFFVAATCVNKLTTTQRVLGASTYLAEDTQPSAVDGQPPQNSHDEANHESSIIMPPQPPQSERSHVSTVNPSTTVDCVGPDSKHFSTTFHACQELNASFQKSHFTFTNLSNDQGSPVSSSSSVWNGGPGRPVSDGASFSSGDLRVPSSDGHHVVLLNGATQIQPDHDKIEINASESGKLITLAPQVLELINSLLAERNISISSSSANGVMIHNGNVQAVSQFPLSVNPQDKSLSVVTPQGTTPLQVLPNQAVQTVLAEGIMSQVQSQASTDVSSSSATPSVDITSLNNQVVFKVNGVTNKKFLGFIPISFAKTSYVSAQNGNVVQTNESFLSKLLEAVSF